MSWECNGGDVVSSGSRRRLEVRQSPPWQVVARRRLFFAPVMSARTHARIMVARKECRLEVRSSP